jgi:hypothetical protein
LSRLSRTRGINYGERWYDDESAVKTKPRAEQAANEHPKHVHGATARMRLYGVVTARESAEVHRCKQ